MNAATASMLEIVEYIERELARGTSTIVLDVADSDLGAGRFAGELVDVPTGPRLVHRPFRVWVDLAERLRLRLRTPRPLDTSLVRLTFDKLVVNDIAPTEPTTEKYGTSSTFARVHKLEDPTFVIDLTEAFDRVVASLTDVRAHVGTTAPLRVLDLGVNTGDELALILARIPALRDATFVGVDHSPSALATARERFASRTNISFVEVDLSTAGAPGDAGARLRQLGRFDLVIAIGLLQSGALDGRELLRTIVQDHLAPRGAVILGMPNCRYVDGEVEYGARIVNITQPELGLLVKDVAFYRKYLQQHHRKVFVTGKHYLLVTAVADEPRE